jgi:hypothetical protein
VRSGLPTWSFARDLRLFYGEATDCTHIAPGAGRRCEAPSSLVLLLPWTALGATAPTRISVLPRLRCCAAYRQRSQVVRYRFAIGDLSLSVWSGSVRLYSYPWYGLQSTKLADIQDGVAAIPRDMERIRRELNPHPNTEAYVILSGHLW